MKERDGNAKQTKLQRKIHGMIEFGFRTLTGLSRHTIITDDTVIGKNVWVGYGTKVVTANHDLKDPSKSQPIEEIRLDDNVWIGANCVILPGVHLGPHTVVGAGAVVTKSFPEGYCLIGGVPAKKIKDLVFDDE